jgi:hypothetical protein
MIMAEEKRESLVYVKDEAGNLFICPLDALRDPKSLSEEEKKNCVSDASDVLLHATEGR